MKRSASESKDDTIFADNIKIIVIGDGSTGKSTYVNYIKYLCQIKNYKFQKNYDPTDDFDLNQIKLETNKGSIIIDLWDTAGQENRGKLRKAYIKGSDGVLVFYDMSEKQTIDNVSTWLNQIQQIAPNVPVAVIGNKSDKFTDIKLSESVKIRECNLQRDVGHNQIKNFLISIKNNSHLEFNITGWLSSTLTIREEQGCLNGLEYILSNICKTNITIN
jgi:small GTP-binding protein